MMPYSVHSALGEIVQFALGKVYVEHSAMLQCTLHPRRDTAQYFTLWTMGTRRVVHCSSSRREEKSDDVYAREFRGKKQRECLHLN